MYTNKLLTPDELETKRLSLCRDILYVENNAKLLYEYEEVFAVFCHDHNAEGDKPLGIIFNEDGEFSTSTFRFSISEVPVGRAMLFHEEEEAQAMIDQYKSCKQNVANVSVMKVDKESYHKIISKDLKKLFAELSEVMAKQWW